MEIIFTFNPQASVYSRWRKRVVAGRTIMEASYNKKTAGLCLGAAITWLKKSIASGGTGVLSADELGSVHEMAIIQSACDILPIPEGAVRSDTITPILQHMHLDSRESMRGFGCFNVQSIYEWVSREPCHCLFVFDKIQDSGSLSGHAIGLRYDGRVTQIFDTHYGLTQQANKDQFMLGLYITAIFNHAQCVGEEWAVFKVCSADD
ncbi:hypothetical protein NX722_05350 [Endozoicomonas gorgoniicola]|uniref:Peptidase C58 YopT-type domain-containing protein n=1 Tax=Endozoicomonas gorgoniicola TaxID=1234144 RepID=A0ABT3MRS7_9GAMM|nr:hypothetical protein [Endozoicomonas gorgoniicola]MCW7552078.1 hypothetical protein [Endozoicomonas gorgoniicola]